MLQDIGAYLDPKKSAVLVIDMQNDFCHPEGAFGKSGVNLKYMHQIVPVLKRFVEAARSLGITIVHVRSFLDEKFLSPSMLARNKQMGRTTGICAEGSWGSEFWEINPAPDEMVLTKHAYSAFVGTDLQQRLSAKGIETIMVTGVVTNVCCESTLRDGFMLGFHAILVDDCCASTEQAAHRATVKNVTNYFGRVRKSADLIPSLQQVKS